MTEDVAKKLTVTFKDGLPLGQRATFTHEKTIWIAYPAAKLSAVHALVDRLVGIHAGIQAEMIRWINQRPQDADLITRVLDKTARARQIHTEVVTEKMGLNKP